MSQKVIPRGRKTRTGFTLIELLTVLAVIGVLASISVPTLSRMWIRAEVTAAKQNLNTLAGAAEVFRLDAGAFPPSYAYDSMIDLQPLERGGEYIGSAQIPDPFQRRPLEEQIEIIDPVYVGGAFAQDGEHGFVYIRYRDFLGNQFPEFGGIGVYSIGPDRADSWLSLYPLPPETDNLVRRRLISSYGAGALNPVVVYNPTNGVFSEGDFGAFRGDFNGFVPEDAF